MANFSNTPLDVTVDIEGVNIGQDVFLTSAVIRNTVNDFPFASVSLGYRTEAGKTALEEIFPQEEKEGVYYKQVVIKASGDGSGESTQFTTLPGEVTLFDGYVVGFSHHKSRGAIDYQLTCRGGPYLLSQVSVAAPGIHSGSGAEWAVYAMQRGALTATTGGASAVLFAGVDLLDTLLDSFRSSGTILAGIKAFAGKVSAPYATPEQAKAYESARKALGFGQVTADIITTELGKLTEIGTENPIFFNAAGLGTAASASPNASDNLIHATALSIVSNFVNAPKVTWWDFLITTFEQFGLDIFFMGSKGFVIPKAALMRVSDDSSVNRFVGADQVSVQNQDAPLSSPTRVILSADHSSNISVLLTGLSSSTPIPVDGITVVAFPEGNEENDFLTEREKETGVKALVINAPGWMREISEVVGGKKAPEWEKILKTSPLHTNFEVAPTPPELETPSGAGQVVEAIAKEYAKYIFYKERFKQRSGSLQCRLKPEAIAGMPATVRDPANIASFDCWLHTVTHTLSYADATAKTSCEFAYSRQGGELKPNPFFNPLYPDFTLDDVETETRAEVEAAAQFFDRLVRSV